MFSSGLNKHFIAVWIADIKIKFKQLDMAYANMPTEVNHCAT